MLGHKTVMRSDHAALQYLKRVKEPVWQQAHWMDFIEQFDLEICHRKGASHANTDALSRKPRCEQDDQACRQCVGCKRDPAGIPAGRWPGERGGRHEHRRAIHGACTECEGRAHPQGSPRTGAVTSRVRARKRDSQGDPSAATAVPNSHGMEGADGRTDRETQRDTEVRHGEGPGTGVVCKQTPTTLSRPACRTDAAADGDRHV